MNYLSDEAVNTFLELRGANMKMLWLDGESLSDESFCNFHKMEKLELLSISFCDTMGSAGLKSISQLSKLGENECSDEYNPFSSILSFSRVAATEKGSRA